MKKIIVLDTETTGLEKPYCYNIGWLVADIDDFTVLDKRSFVVEQIWHNNELFASAYYADKRPLYVADMRAKKTVMDKWGYIMRQLARDIKNFEIIGVYAYNSAFDEKVIDFNCNWFKTINPLDNTPIFDIWAYAQNFIVDNDYKEFCDKLGLYTDTGNYKTSAEVMTKYLYDEDFIEEHTALADSEIEYNILTECITRGAKVNNAYPLKRSIPKVMEREITIKKNGKVEYTTTYKEIWKKRDLSEIRLKD